MSSKHEWFPTETAPKDYPVFLGAATMTLPGGQRILVPDGRVANSGWGQTGSIQIIEPSEKPAPEGLDLVWYGLVERQGYRARVALSAGQIANMLNNGAIADDGTTRAPYSRVVIGMAPGGDLAVWLSAGRIVHQVGMYQAAPANLAVNDLTEEPYPTIEAFRDETINLVMPQDILKKVESRPPPLGFWRQMQQRYDWEIRLPGLTGGDILWITSGNGECNWIDLSGKRKSRQSSLGAMAVPQRIELNWRNSQGVALRGVIDFDLDEAVKAYGTLSREAAGKPMVLTVEPGDTALRFDIFLRVGTLAYRFERAAGSILPK